MKKLTLVVVLFFVIAGASLFAQDNGLDLTKFPSCMENGDWIINFGVGLPYFSSGYSYFPPIRLSFDRNTGLGEQKLPFFFGGIVGYSNWGIKLLSYSVHSIPIGARIGYHFNWGVDNLDTYAVATVGTRITIVTGTAAKSYHTDFSDWLYIGASIGARYFINDFFGFWAEMGYTSSSWLDLGLSFKF